MRPDPEQFAAQVNYLAAIGRLVVPRAFGFVGRRTLFVGHSPFHPEELGGLLPEQAEWHEQGYAPRGFSPDILVLGRDGFEKGEIKAALQIAIRAPKVVPQEGFVDELLFGHDWWDEETASLGALVKHHRGLQSARSLGALTPAGIPELQSGKKPAMTRPRPSPVPPSTRPEQPGEGDVLEETAFSWPSTDAEESKGRGQSEIDYQMETRLHQLGYRITGRSRSQRWRVLISTALPELGLEVVANTIAFHCRTRKRQKGGRQKYSHAIAEWEYDLARLKREIYRSDRHRFPWPKSEP
jgi:hypothetical protein